MKSEYPNFRNIYLINLFKICQRLVEVCIADHPSTDLPGCDNVTVTIIYFNDLSTLYKRYRLYIQYF